MNVLYILMRTDLPSMNAGKAMAQASHASNAFVHKGKQDIKGSSDLMMWQNETKQGFGTVLVLAVNGQELKNTVKEAERLGFTSGIVIDPTYPFKVNGEIATLLDDSVDRREYEGNKEYTLYRTENTCGYVFGPKDEPLLKQVVGGFKLHA
jgi:peptidyl-tRNA hydrolase